MRNDLSRSDFPSVRAYTYYSVWSRFIARENESEDFFVSEDASEEEIQKLRIKAGVCISDVLLNPEERTATLPSSVRCAFKPKQQLWLSRDSQEKDWFTHPLEIKEVTNASTLIFSERTTFPEDAAEGKWILDLVHNQLQASQLLRHLKDFALKSDDALHKLVVDDLLCDPEALHAAQLPPGPTACRKTVEEAVSVHGLNDRQTEALWQVFQHRCSLIQGPPGTGKTRTARAIACLNESCKRFTLLTAVTNLAVDNLAMTVAQHIETGIARVASQRYEDELRQSKDTPGDLQDMLYPEMVRRHLDSMNYVRDSNAYSRHIKTMQTLFSNLRRLKHSQQRVPPLV